MTYASQLTAIGHRGLRPMDLKSSEHPVLTDADS
jgi:hypothetical protein